MNESVAPRSGPPHPSGRGLARRVLAKAKSSRLEKEVADSAAILAASAAVEAAQSLSAVELIDGTLEVDTDLHRVLGAG